MEIIKDFFASIDLSGLAPAGEVFIPIVRWIFPLLATALLLRCFLSLRSFPSSPEIWAYISLQNGARIPVTHWENVIGRAAASDIRIELPTISRSHAVLMRTAEDTWRIRDLKSTSGLFIDGVQTLEFHELDYGDSFSIGGVVCTLTRVPDDELLQAEASHYDKLPGLNPVPGMLLLTAMQILCGLCFLLGGEAPVYVPLIFLALCVMMWVYGLIARALTGSCLETELIAFFLSTLGLSVVASSAPQVLFKQFAAIAAGLFAFILLGLFIKKPERAVKLRWLMAAGAVGLFALNIVYGYVDFGAKNWLTIAGVSIQPSEFVKVAFIYAGAATLDRLFARRNLVLFVLLTGFCLLTLAYIADFGTALVFFAAFIVIAFLRSGDLAAVVLVCAGALFAGLLVLRMKPYVAERFASWGSAWSSPYDAGFQQTRAMTAAASGGLIGLGPGRGNLVGIGAADTDLVFGVLCEEWGFITAALAVISVSALAFFVIRAARTARSSFYVIAACGAVSMLVVQTLLNTMGCMDILPFTGVTFPFVSNGGSSLVACWGLLAFVKAIDTRFDDQQFERIAVYDEPDSPETEVQK